MRTPWWRKLLGFGIASKSRPKSPCRKLQLEVLEGRLAPATLDLVGTTLTFTLDSGASAAMSGTATNLTFDAGAGNTVTANVGAQGLGFTTGAQTSVTGDLTTVTALDIVGAAGNEVFTIGTSGGTFPTFDVASTVETTVLDAAAFSTGTDSQTYHGPASVYTNSNLTGSTVTFSSTLDDVTADSHALTITGDAEFDGVVGTTELKTLTVTGAANIDTTAITTGSTQAYDGAVTISTSTDLTGSTVTFGSTVDDATADTHTLTVTGDADFAGVVGGTELKTLTVTAATNIATTAISTGSTQAYDGAVTINASTDLTGSTVTFGGTVDDATADTHTLTVTGDADFDGVIGTTELKTLTVTGATNIDTTAITTGGTQAYDGAVTISANTDLTGATATFGGTVDDATSDTHTLTITGDATFDGVVGGTELKTLTVTGAANIDTSAITTGGAQNYDGAVTISASTNLTGSTVTFGGTVDDATADTDTLTVTGDATFDGVVGTTELKTLTVTAATNIDTSAITTGGAQNYDGAVTIGASTDLTGSTITFGSTVDDATADTHTLTITGNATFDGVVGATELKTLTVTAATDIDTSAITTGGAQNYDGAVTISASTNLTGSTVTFGGTVDDATADTHTLTITGDADFDGVVGTTELKTLTVTAATNIDTSAITTGSTQAYDGAVTINASTNLTGSTVTFGGTVDDATADTDTITITGNAVFDGVVGATELKTLTVTGAANIDTTAITTGGTQAYDGAVTISASTNLTGSTVTFGSTVDDATADTHTLTITGDATFDGVVGATELKTLTVTGAANIDTTAITTGSTQAYDGAVTISASTDLTGSTVTFGGTVDDATADSHALTITGDAEFDGVVGTTELKTLTVTGAANIDTTAITTGSTQAYDGAVTISANTDLTGSTVTFGGTVDDATADTHTLTITGDATFDGVVGMTELKTLAVTAAANIDTTAITTGGTQAYDGAVTISAKTDLTGSTVAFGSTVDDATSDTHTLTITGDATFGGVVGATELKTLTVTGAANIDTTAITTGSTQAYDGAVTISTSTDLTGSTVTFGSTVDDATADTDTLTVTGDATFDGVVGTTELKTLTVTAATNIDTSAITTGGAQNYDGAATISANTDLTGSTVTFGGTVDDATADTHTLTITGDATFGGVVGATELKTLTVTGAANIDTTAITTGSTQAYDGAVTISASTNLTGSTVTFGSTVDDATADTHTLTITGDADFDGVVGTTGLKTLTVTGAANIDTTTITTGGAQNYDGAVTISASTNLTGSTVTFGSTVDDATANTHTLTITGDATFDGVVGGTELKTLTVTAATDIDTTAITTGGTQAYDGAVTVSANTDLTGATATFGGTVDDATANTHTLTITGDADFDGVVGTIELKTLTVTVAANIDATAITTGSTQAYDGAVTISTSTDLTGATVTFGSTVDDATSDTHTLTITGDATFDGVVGTTELKTLTVTAATNIDTSAITTGGAQNYDGAVTISANTDLTGSTLTFGGTVDDATADTHTLTITGDADFDGVVGTTELKTLTVTGATNIDTTAITTGSTQAYDGAVTISASTNLTGSTVTFGGTVDDATAGTDTVTVTGNATFDGVVGTTELKTLTVTGATDIDTSAITTGGAQNYDGNVTLGASTVLTHTGSNSLTISGTTLSLTDFNLTDSPTTAGSTGSIAAQITGTGGISKAGPGDLTLSNAANNYAGNTNVLDGTLTAGAVNALPTGTTLTLGNGADSGTFDLDGNAQTVASVGISGTGTTNTVTDSGAAATFTVSVATGTDTYAGLLTGPLTLAKQGAGTLTLSNAGSTYTGGTTITGGTLSISGDGSLGTPPAAAAVNISIGAATLQASSAVTLADTRNINLTGAATIGSATAGDAFVIGGTVSGNSTLTLSGPGNVTLSGSASITSASGDGVDLKPGGDIKTAVFVIDNADIANNTGSGIQIFAGVGNVTLNNSTISGNSAGIDADNTFNNTLALNDDTLNANTAGGIAIASGSLNLINDTLDSNTTTGDGGGIDFASTGALSITNCTIAHNSASAGGGVFTAVGATLVNTILAQNTAGADPDVDGLVPAATGFNNLIGDGTGLSAGSIANGDGNHNQVGTAATPIDPLLATLGNYGGPTETDALLPGSPALDAGDNAFVTLNETDQRGDPRIVNTTVDIGAFESSGFTVTPQNLTAGTNRTLVTEFFVDPADGSTHLEFQAKVAANNPSEPIAGGILTFSATTVGGATATPQTLTMTVTANGLASTQAVANGTPSPAAGTPYELEASAGGNNAPGTWNMYNQVVTSLFYNVPGGNASPASPQNAQSGAIIPLKSTNGATSTTFTVTLQDQETTPQTVAITGQTVSLRAIYGTGSITGASKTTPIVITSPANGLVTGQRITISGVLGNTAANGTFTVTVVNANQFRLNGSVGNGVYVAGTGSFEKGFINAIGTPAGSPTVTLTGGMASTTTVAGVASFANLQVFQSVYTTPYVLKAYYTNPAPDSTPVTTGVTSSFRVLPYEFLITGGNFAGLLQTAYNVSEANSSRGAIRLLSITASSGLKTNQLRVQAFDYASVTKKVVAVTPATLYDGPVFLTFNVAAVLLAPHLVFAPNVPTLLPTDMTAGVLVLNNLTVTGAVPATGFKVNADFGLTAGVPPADAPLIFDAAGFAEVNDNLFTDTTTATFLRINLGRLRGR